MATESKIVSLVPRDNYATWKLQCKMALMKEGTHLASEVTIAKYPARKDRALATIVLSIEPSLLYLLQDPKEPVEVWNKLESQFQKKTWANKLVLRRKLYSLRLKDGESVQQHIKEN